MTASPSQRVEGAGCKCVICSVFHDPVSKGRILNSTSIKTCDRLRFCMIFFYSPRPK